MKKQKYMQYEIHSSSFNSDYVLGIVVRTETARKSVSLETEALTAAGRKPDNLQAGSKTKVNRLILKKLQVVIFVNSVDRLMYHPGFTYTGIIVGIHKKKQIDTTCSF